MYQNKCCFTENTKTISKTIADWMTSTSLYQAPNPYTINPFKKDQNNVVTEVDGTPCRNFFTVLNVGKCNVYFVISNTSYHRNFQISNLICKVQVS